MFSEKRRNHWSFIFQETFSSLKNLFFLLILSLFNIKQEGIFVIIGLSALSIVFGVYRYFNRKFYLNDDIIVVEKGFIFKKKLELPFDKVNTIDISRDLIDKMVGSLTIKIDSGAVKTEEEEVRLKLKLDEGYTLRDLISSKKTEKQDILLDEEVENKDILLERTITFKELFVYSITKGKLVWFISLIFVCLGFLDDIGSAIENTLLPDTIDYIGNNVNTILDQNIGYIILYLILAIVILFLIINIFFIVVESVRLYNFNIKGDKKNIYIKYGLLKTKEYTIPIKKVHALRYRQSILQQMLKVFTLEAVTIGYGDEKNETALVFPIANKAFIDKVIVQFLPQFKSEAQVNKPPKRAVSRFLVKRNIVFVVAYATLAIINVMDIKILTASTILLILANSVLGFINYKNTSLSVDDKVIKTSSGSLSKITNIIKQSSIQSITIVEGPFHRMKSVVDFKIDIYTNKLVEIVMISNMDKSLEKKVESNIEY